MCRDCVCKSLVAIAVKGILKDLLARAHHLGEFCAGFCLRHFPLPLVQHSRTGVQAALGPIVVVVAFGRARNELERVARKVGSGGHDGLNRVLSSRLVGAGFELQTNRAGAWATLFGAVLLTGLTWLLIFWKGL